MNARIDEPASGATVDPLCFFVRGWVWLRERHDAIVAIEAWSADVLLGSTRALYPRPDVTSALLIESPARNGFELYGHHPAASFGQQFEVQIRARLADGSRTDVLATCVVSAIARDYRQHDFGVLLDQRTVAVQREPNIFATGPSQAEGSPELAALLRRHLGPPPQRIIDVGCGIGSYGRGLLADGYEWLGVEIEETDCAELARMKLPHRQVDGRTLPFPDHTFDAALALEVLEHIDEPHAFLREIKRVAPRRFIVTVPNCELLAYLWTYHATPWHMLESTHVNYFTRWSLGALLREYYQDVEVSLFGEYPLRTPEGTRLHYHLLAIATSP